MKKEYKIGVLSILLIALAILSYILYVNVYLNYMIISITFTIICAIVLINYILNNRSVESIYQSKVRKILKTYDSILVKSKNLPKLDEKNIIKVDSIEDLVDAQMEIRKPIYYQQQEQSCSFVLLDHSEACIYIIKLNENVLCPLEIVLKDLELKNKAKKKKDDISEEILNDIDKTTIVRIDKGKYLKVSPIRSKKNLKEKIKETKSEEVKKEENVDSIKKEENKRKNNNTKEEKVKDSKKEENLKSKVKEEKVDSKNKKNDQNIEILN